MLADWRQVPLDDIGHVLGRYARVPDVIGIDEDHGALVVAAGARVAQHDVRREPAPLDLGPERLDELCPALFAAASLAGGSADEDLSERRHGLILCGARDKSRQTELYVVACSPVSACSCTRRAIPLSLAFSATASATAGATRSSKTLGMM